MKEQTDKAKKITMIVNAIEYKYESIDNWIKLHKKSFLEKKTGKDIVNMRKIMNSFKNQPAKDLRSKNYNIFYNLAGISDQEFELSCEYLAKVISQKFSIEERHVLQKEPRYIGSVRLGLESDASHIRNNFNNHLKGYWVGIHYWDVCSGDKIINIGGNTSYYKDEQKEERYIFRHVFYFYDFNDKTREIKVKFASARNREGEYNYEGNMSISGGKKYFFLETIKAMSDVEVVMIVTRDFPDTEDMFHGIMLASTSKKGCSNKISRPAASRIILKKIQDGNDKIVDICFLLKKYIGIYHDSFFNEEVRKWIDNQSKETEEVAFFPEKDGALAAELKEIEKKSPSITKPLASNEENNTK